MIDAMATTARDLMTTKVQTVRPDMTLPDLERALLEARVSGFPVVSNGRLVGVISRSDIVRQLAVEQSVAEITSGYQLGLDTTPEIPDPEVIGEAVGRRMEDLRIEDVMVRAWIGVPPDAPLRDVARRLVEHRIHRLLVVEDDRLLGIVTSLDIVRVVAEGTLDPR